MKNRYSMYVNDEFYTDSNDLDYLFSLEAEFTTKKDYKFTKYYGENPVVYIIDNETGDLV